MVFRSDVECHFQGYYTENPLVDQLIGWCHHRGSMSYS